MLPERANCPRLCKIKRGLSGAGCPECRAPFQLMRRKKIPELMAPAGDFISLSAALNAGADAVYFGLRGSNMRAGAKNFALSDMPRIVRECRAAGAKCYLTLNTIYFDSEMRSVLRQLKAAKKAGVDAVIAWDFSVLELARELGIEVFLSTQASVANARAAASIFRNYGVRRFVLARECSLECVEKIRAGLRKILGRDAAEIRLEMFAHGAMCVSVSGRCFMSQFYCGKSANRGECLQPCRRRYLISDADTGKPEFELGANCVLSPKDLMTLPFVEKLVDAGANSLKIEGRNRNASYVSATVSAYRRALDFYRDNFYSPTFAADFAALKKSLCDELSKTFNRGFSDGFFMGKPVGDWTSDGNRAALKKRILGHVLNYYSKLGVAEISIDDAPLCRGAKIQLEGETTGFLEFAADSIQMRGNPVDSAQKGDVVAVKVPQKVRRNDRLYILSDEK